MPGRILTIIFFIFTVPNLFGQTTYSGFIGKFPVELVTNIYSDGDARAIYSYKNYDEPIVINGRLNKKTLVLYEKNNKGQNIATLTFENLDDKSKTLDGIWKNLTTKKELTISLTKDFDIEYGDSIEWENREIIQPVSFKGYYFKLILTKSKDDFFARIAGVKILQKKSDSLIQQIDLDCQLLGIDNISIGDYNFDGVKDFSVFESSYAGPNTSRLYFLYSTKTKKYFNSGFEGTSLEFDSKKKRIFEHNQCCAGSQHTTAVYKVVNNKMVLIEQHCFIWDEKKQDLVERKMKDCE